MDQPIALSSTVWGPPKGHIGFVKAIYGSQNGNKGNIGNMQSSNKWDSKSFF